jgi:tRNA-Thr(GGU) m(6)t(6)A37 methyltransferase TsaA
LDDKEHGIFSIRAPNRPNPIGLSVVKLLEIKENKLFVSEIDMIDGTPLIDIKPYVPDFDVRIDATKGWLKNKI